MAPRLLTTCSIAQDGTITSDKDSNEFDECVQHHQQSENNLATQQLSAIDRVLLQLEQDQKYHLLTTIIWQLYSDAVIK